MAKRRGVIRRLLVISGALAIFAAGSIAVPNLVVAYAAKGYEYVAIGTVPTKSVTIVPGARVHGGKPFLHLAARLEAALALYRANRVKAILVSGRNTKAAPEVQVMRDWLLDRGVRPEDILADAEGSRTRETMNRAVSQFGLREAVVCTQEVNMPRTLFIAEQAGIDAVGLSIPSNLSSSSRYAATEALKTVLAVLESHLGDDQAISPRGR